MNAGFSNLTSIKAQMLAANQQAKTDWDAKIAAIGKGVAGSFEKFCNRKFMRVAAQQDVFGADRSQFLLARYPVEPPITTVEFKLDEPTGWVVQPQGPVNTLQSQSALVFRSLDAVAGVVYFPEESDCGPYWSQLRFTYTGGYFWEQLEPVDVGYPTAVPPTANLLPNELLFAWQMQCRKVWEAIDKIGSKILTVGSNARQVQEVMAGLDLVPEVREILSSYVRYEFT